MSYSTQLYPPIVPVSLPAYDGHEALRVYFQVSVANSREQFKHAQVLINRLNSNSNALNTSISAYQYGYVLIKNEQILYDASRHMYYFDLPVNLLDNTVIYKLQVRVGEQDLNTVTLSTTWFNSSTFSEWSTVCLIKPIVAPVFDLVGFDTGSEPSVVGSVNVATSQDFVFTGTYTPYTGDDEPIFSYQMKLYEAAGAVKGNLLSDSGVKNIGIYEATNIQHAFEYLLENGKNYYVEYITTSKNGYVKSKTYKIIVDYTAASFTNELMAIPNPDLARIELSISLSGMSTAINAIAFRRSSNRSNFNKWEDVFITSTAGKTSIDYNDIFVESGIVYKYAIQPIQNQLRGQMASYVTAVLDYEHSWLIGEDEKQLMFAYNPSITNFARNVKDSITETIGSKYPFTTRNAHVNYISFQFSATISKLMDVENNFEDLAAAEYGNFFSDRARGYIHEREFRNKVIDFLYDENPKLFKSDTEGLILVKLSSISLTPKTELGKTIYDLSCTVTEIGKVDFENLISYNIKKGVKINEL